MPWSDGPFEVIEKIGPNAYKIDLLGDYGVLATFNVADLSPYYDKDEQFLSLRPNANKSEEYDETISWNHLKINQQARGTLQAPRRSRKFMLWSKKS